MAEEIVIKSEDKSAKYEELLPQIEALIFGENSKTANLANIAAALHQTFDFLWTGFYETQKDELVLGPFQGPVACTRIAKNKGVCGTSWNKKETLVVPNVHEFPGHIACSSASNSEIVVPVFSNEHEVLLILDIDSDQFNCFDLTDKKYLEILATIISKSINQWT